jgi:alpha-beta hydrolase superfamily lysophospholipase
MAEAPVKVKPDTVVMIHGLWMTPRSWEHWKERYEARGYTVHAPAWPGFEGEVEALNADPSPMKDLRAETSSMPTRLSSTNWMATRSSWVTPWAVRSPRFC